MVLEIIYVVLSTRVVAKTMSGCQPKVLQTTRGYKPEVVANYHGWMRSTSGCTEHSWQGFCKLVYILMSRPGKRKDTIDFLLTST